MIANLKFTIMASQQQAATGCCEAAGDSND
jgi:hypothetical protein